MAQVANCVFGLALLGVTPLAVFLLIQFFMPDLLLLLDSPSN